MNLRTSTNYDEKEEKVIGGMNGIGSKACNIFSKKFIIECKGRANDTFPIRWKLFKNLVKDQLPHVTLYKPQNQKECDKVIELILKKRNER